MTVELSLLQLLQPLRPHLKVLSVKLHLGLVWFGLGIFAFDIESQQEIAGKICPSKNLALSRHGWQSLKEKMQL